MQSRVAAIAGAVAVVAGLGGCAMPLGGGGPVTSTVSAHSAPATPSHVVVGLGDSVVSGDGCDCDYVHEYAAGLGGVEKTSVRTVNYGQGGVTAASLAESLRTDQALRAAVAGADIVLVTVGANDLWDAHDTWVAKEACDPECYQPLVDAMAGSVEQSLQQVRALATRPGAQVLVTNYWNVFEAGQTARQWYGEGFLEWTNEITIAANQAICAAAQRQDVACVDIDAAFAAQGADPTPLLADDGDHPNAAGTAVIAKALLDATTWHG